MHDTLDLFVKLQPLWDWWKSPGWAYYAVRKVREILQSNLLDRNICTWIYAGNSAKPGSFFSSPIIHLIQSKASVTFRGGKRYFCCIFSIPAQFNPTPTLKAQGLIPSLVKAFVWGWSWLLAPASLSLPYPSKLLLADLHSGLPLKKPLSQAYTAPHLKI